MDVEPQIAAEGYALLPGVYSVDECRQFSRELTSVLAACGDESTALRRANGALYGARNLLDVYAPAAALWQRQPLVESLSLVLGNDFGLVRGLYFDKPPDNTWSLPWHRDLTIAVRDNSVPAPGFRNPTIKGGVQHLEAPDEVLQNMLTLRIHLDDATPENGPLQVIPATHTSRDATATQPPEVIVAQAGDVLAMRPLLVHSSGASREGTALTAASFIWSSPDKRSCRAAYSGNGSLRLASNPCQPVTARRQSPEILGAMRPVHHTRTGQPPGWRQCSDRGFRWCSR
jgi:hypothetical protein